MVEATAWFCVQNKRARNPGTNPQKATENGCNHQKSRGTLVQGQHEVFCLFFTAHEQKLVSQDKATQKKVTFDTQTHI